MKTFFTLGSCRRASRAARYVFTMIGPEPGTRFGKEAFPVGAEAPGLLPGTRGHEEVGGGAPYIVDIALEIRGPAEGGGLPDQAFLAAGGDGPALVKGNGAGGRAL
jgi:hypothetical protein